MSFTETKENTELISECNKDIFSIIWGPVIASLSVVFDTTVDQSVIEKSLNGFYSCATISAHYNLNEVFDKIVVSFYFYSFFYFLNFLFFYFLFIFYMFNFLIFYIL